MRPTPRRHAIGPRRRLRPGLALRRDPRLWWAVVITLALGVGMATSRFVSTVERTRSAWGASVRVLVAARDLAPGTQVSPGDVRWEARPRATVPRSALRSLPADATVREGILRGEVVVASRLARAGLSEVAARIASGMRAVAIPTEPGTAPPLSIGDRVDVLVALPPEAAGDGPPGFTLVSDAAVVSVEDASVTVAVPLELAPRIAVALGQGAVTLALVGA